MTSLRSRALLLLVASVALAGLVSACGNRREQITQAETEGPYLNVGALKYQVQISRPLNPHDIEDRAYLRGVSPQEGQLRQDETWFAVFLRVVNETDRTHPSAKAFEIEDTRGKRFEPLVVTGNAFAYQPTRLPPRGTIPAHGSIAEGSPIGGQMLLFKITLNSLANRPLELMIRSPQGSPRQATVALDV